MRWRTQLISTLGFLLALSATASAQSASIKGTWLTENKSHVTISKCGNAYCGKLTKVSVPPQIYAKFKTQIDKVGVEQLPDYFNKDPALRTRRMLGLQILTLDKETSPTTFEGTVYNAEDGETYFGKIEVKSNDQVRLSGCVFFNVLCRSEDWKRVR